MTIKDFRYIISKCKKHWGPLRLWCYIELDWVVARIALKNNWVIPKDSDLMYNKRCGNKYRLNGEKCRKFLYSETSDIFDNIFNDDIFPTRFVPCIVDSFNRAINIGGFKRQSLHMFSSEDRNLIQVDYKPMFEFREQSHFDNGVKNIDNDKE